MATKRKSSKSKVIAKRVSSSRSTSVSTHHVTLRSIIALMAVLLSFSVLILFSTYKDNIVESGSFGMFIGLSSFLLMLMLVLMYLVNPKK